MMACWLVVRLLAPAQSAGSCREAREEGEGGPVLDRDAVLAVVVAAAVDEEAVAGRAERGVLAVLALMVAARQVRPPLIAAAAVVGRDRERGRGGRQGQSGPLCEVDR